ncbi:uncharacterized protein J3R85_011677 [Psidium guajava]|nr:uncharacterized protein J3R85_011677 [Psidium guajava]
MCCSIVSMHYIPIHYIHAYSLLLKQNSVLMLMTSCFKVLHGLKGQIDIHLPPAIGTTTSALAFEWKHACSSMTSTAYLHSTMHQAETG